jgi:hypothetical protein
MKKLISILLALVMVLGIAVPSFAGTVELKPAPEAKNELIALNTLELNADGNSVVIAGKGGTYYLMLDPAIKYTNVSITASGNVEASIVDYDPAKYEAIPGVTYGVWNKSTGEWMDQDVSYEYAREEADRLNKANKVTYYMAKADGNANIFVLHIADNYDRAYAEGKLVIKAYNEDAKCFEGATVKVVRDVVIFEYEQVKWAAANKDTVLVCGHYGYSDYETALNGYGTKYEVGNLRSVEGATVICTTAFRAIEGKDVKVESADMTVTIKDVAKGQKGVNFAAYGVKEVDENKDGDIEEVVFGFYGKQAINSKFEIELDTGYTWYTLREAFELRLEERDVVTYTVYKDGQPYASFEIDYADAKEAYAPVELVIKGEAGTTLGEYSIQVGEAEFPAEEVEDEVVEEANPNTGAPSFLEWLWMLIFS